MPPRIGNNPEVNPLRAIKSAVLPGQLILDSEGYVLTKFLAEALLAF